MYNNENHPEIVARFTICQSVKFIFLQLSTWAILAYFSWNDICPS
jgi:hypothetical protein